MTGCTTWDIANSHFFVLFVDVCIIFCLYKTGPQKKQHNTSPHFLFCFSYQNLGRRNYIFAQLLVIKSRKCSTIFDTVGEHSLPPSSWLLLVWWTGVKSASLHPDCWIVSRFYSPIFFKLIFLFLLRLNLVSHTSKKSLFWWWLIKNDQALYWS